MPRGSPANPLAGVAVGSGARRAFAVCRPRGPMTRRDRIRVGEHAPQSIDDEKTSLDAQEETTAGLTSPGARANEATPDSGPPATDVQAVLTVLGRRTPEDAGGRPLDSGAPLSPVRPSSGRTCRGPTSAARSCRRRPSDGRTCRRRASAGRTCRGHTSARRTCRGRNSSRRTWRGRTSVARTWKARTLPTRAWRGRTSPVRTWRGRASRTRTWKGRTSARRTWRARTSAGRTWRGRTTTRKRAGQTSSSRVPRGRSAMEMTTRADSLCL